MKVENVILPIMHKSLLYSQHFTLKIVTFQKFVVISVSVALATRVIATFASEQYLIAILENSLSIDIQLVDVQGICQPQAFD